MKIFNIFFVILIASFNISCDDVCYSCNTEIDSWAKRNKEYLKSLDRNELSHLSLSKQKAAFRTFNPKKRQQLWLSKLNQVKSIVNSKNEIEHLKKIERFIMQHNFLKELSKSQAIFLSSWFKEGQNKYSWNFYFLVSGFVELNNDATFSKEEFESKFKNYKARPAGLDSGISGCDCRWDLSCELANLGSCSGTCESTTLGCGWFLMQSCTGDCSG